MRFIRAFLFLVTIIFANLAFAGTIEVTIHGMTCSFCADGLQRNLIKLPDVQKVDVSLKQKKVRLETKPGTSPDVDNIKKAVIDAGFTPIDVKTISD